MKIFAIIDDYTDKEIGYFFCYEKFNQCYIEFTGDIDEWDLPIFLEHFVRNGKRIVPPNWTKKWIQTRIIPSDRQNLGSILKENGLDSYDEIKLFLLADGRCAQDECYIRKISENELPQDIIERRKKRIKTAVYNGNGSYLITFKDGKVATFDVNQTMEFERYRRFAAYTRLLASLDIDAAGIGLSFNEQIEISYKDIYDQSNALPITEELLDRYALNRFISTGESTDILHCSRQNIDDLVKRNKISPVDIKAKNKMFFRSDIMELLE